MTDDPLALATTTSGGPELWGTLNDVRIDIPMNRNQCPSWIHARYRRELSTPGIQRMRQQKAS
jgi:hypothetical protein